MTVVKAVGNLSLTFLLHRREQIWEDVIITHPKGSGKQCPEEMEEETRECVRDCPAGALSPAEGGTPEEKQVAGAGGVEMEVVGVAAEGETYCGIEQELWTPCSADCLQERYLDEACDKEAEVTRRLARFRFVEEIFLLVGGKLFHLV